MSHIHIPDGVLPFGVWLTCYLFTALIVLMAIRKIEREDVRKKVPFLGVVSALMLITMSVPVGALPFHINLTVLTGILAGPWLGFLALFIVNLLLAFVGHGGITVVGVNTLILGVELFLGWGIFRLLRKRVHDLPAIGMATVIALLISTVMMVAVVGISQAGWEYALPHSHEQGEHPADGVDHDQPMEAKAIQDASGTEESTLAPLEDSTDERDEESGDETTGQKEGLGQMLSEVSFLSVSGLTAIALILLIGIALEVLVTVFMVRFLQRVRPDLIG